MSGIGPGDMVVKNTNLYMCLSCYFSGAQIVGNIDNNDNSGEIA